MLRKYKALPDWPVDNLSLGAITEALARIQAIADTNKVVSWEQIVQSAAGWSRAVDLVMEGPDATLRASLPKRFH